MPCTCILRAQIFIFVRTRSALWTRVRAWFYGGYFVIVSFHSPPCVFRQYCYNLVSDIVPCALQYAVYDCKPSHRRQFSNRKPHCKRLHSVALRWSEAKKKRSKSVRVWVDGVHRRGKAANGNWRRKRKKERTKKQKVKRWSCACDQSAPSSATIIACTIHTTQRYILYSAKLTQSEWKKEGKNWSPYPRWTALSSDKWQLLSNDLKCVRERGKMHIPQCINNWLAVCSCTIESAACMQRHARNVQCWKWNYMVAGGRQSSSRRVEFGALASNLRQLCKSHYEKQSQKDTHTHTKPTHGTHAHAMRS